MSETITARHFHETGWRIVREDACARFRTGSLAEGLAFVDAIGRIDEIGDREVDIDLRPGGVTVRLPRHEAEGLGERDLALARRISSVGQELRVPIDTTGLQHIQLAIDALVIPEVLPFWRAVLGYEAVADEDLLDPHAAGPPVWFQQMDAPRPQRNRIHVDVYVPHEQAEARVAAALAAGGHLVSDENAPEWWTLADAEGNEADVAPWPDDPERPLAG